MMSVRFSLFTNAWRTPARSALALVTLTFFSACATDQAPTGPSANDASPNAVIAAEGLASPAWQALAGTLAGQASFSALAAARAYPFLGVAQYLAVQKAEAVYGTDAATGNGLGAGGRDRYEAIRGAVAGSSSVVLNALFPTKASAIAALKETQSNEGPGGVHDAFTAGVIIGESVGAVMVARAAADGFSGLNVARPFAGATWISSPTPGLPSAGGQLMAVTRWFLTSTDQFRPGPPPAVGSDEFNTSLLAIRTLTNSRSAAQEQSAIDWAQGPGTPTTAGYWLDYAATASVRDGLTEREATHVFALVSTTMADAIIGCWDAKFAYWFIRPWNADAEVKIIPVVGRPNHPSYPSGHSCVSASAAAVLASFFDSPAEITHLNDLVAEAGMSRMIGGLHYDFDVSAGQTLGRNLAAFTIARDASGTSVLTVQ